jgi:hypothetical protein
VEGVTANLVAMYDVHIRDVPTGKYFGAQSTTNASLRSFYKRSHTFTTAIDKALENMAAHHANPVVMAHG